MKKFEGVLICSDWDGTLFADGKLPENTRKAIEYFKAEGGLFSISSGRGPEYIKEMSTDVYPNTYAICYGGALITDIFTNENLKKQFLDEDVLKTVDLLLSSPAKTKTVNIMLENNVILHYTPQEYYENRSDIPTDAYKITLTGESSVDGDIYAQAAKEVECEKYTLARSYSSYIEIMKTENTKGSSAKILKEKLNAKLLVGIGDYENDIPLFKSTDISFAVANAVEELKDVSTHVLTRNAAEGAIEEAISIIERKYLIK